MGSSIIEVQGLEKYFMVTRPLYKQFLAPFCGREKVLALRDVSFNVNAGEIIGIVGPNGAGKTTLLRILADLLKADVGQVIFCGQQLSRYGCRLRSKIGYVSSDERSFFWRLTGRQNLYFFSHLYGLPRTQARRRISSMLDVFSLNDKADRLFRDYSTGTRKKFALIRGLMHQPSILLLDELTNSLDPVSSQSVKSLVRGYVQEQQDCAVIWSTHRLEEVGQICDKVLIIDNGLMKFFGAVSELQDRTEPKEVFFAKIKTQDETNPV